MGQIHYPKENDNFKGESFLSRQRHSTELISPVEQMARPSEQHFPDNRKANSGQIQNLSEDIPDNLRELNIPPSGEDYPSQNFRAGVKGYSDGKNMPFVQKEFPPQNFPPDNRQYSEKKTKPYNQKEYSAQNFPANHREHFKQNNVPPSENEFWSPEIFIENRETRPEDEISKIISRCENNRECAGNGVCIKGQATGFCRCLPNYHGNGISCWEDMIPRNARKFSNVKIRDRTNTGLINF
ncbi:hypothetical protein AVEN_27823-1 [Araneus ventricosus]|uniref:EGF-like domain-containing protein n=1 Tax=Araneus ventricosus TaxID=182803 RepID=A0A4Y2GTK2_ARAVE|nr:hypothetical protein AVEN_27823-1 [Araneus ventricosus]